MPSDAHAFDDIPTAPQAEAGRSPPPATPAASPAQTPPSPLFEALQSNRVVHLLDEQVRRWRSGERVLVELLLEHSPEVRSDHPGVLALLYNEVQLRKEIGETPSPQEYAQRFPDYAEELKTHLESDAGLATPRVDTGGPSTFVGSPLPSRLLPNEPKHVGRYEIRGRLGEGGMGVVYRAYDPQLKRLVALKTIQPDRSIGATEKDRFLREAEAAAKLKHPNVVNIHDYGEEAGRPYFTMPLVEGGSLARHIDAYRFGTPIKDAAGRTTGLDLHGWSRTQREERRQKILTLMEQVCWAVHEAHQHGVFHRDLKPSNILLEESGSRNQGTGIRNQESGIRQQEARKGNQLSGRGNGSAPIPDSRMPIPVVSDFGLAKVTEADVELTPDEAFLGTPAYMSPEQHRGKTDEVGAASDIWALGVILYELFTGRRPYDGASRGELSAAVLKGSEPARPKALVGEIDKDLDAVISRCLEKEPADRFQDAEGLAEELSRVRRREPTKTRPQSPLHLAWRFVKRHTAEAAAGAVFVGSMVVVLLLWVFAPANSPQRQPAADGDGPTCTVYVSTDPPGARVVLVPIDEFGDRQPGRAIRPAESVTPCLVAAVPAGMYVVEVEVPGYGFQQVYRTVPRAGQSRSTFTIANWSRRADGVIEWPLIPIRPTQDAVRGMAFFSGGKSLKGADEVPEAKERARDAGPSHWCELLPFYLDTTEVTVRAYQEIMGNVPAALRETFKELPAEFADYPVTCVRYFDALEYAEKAGKRLMTDDEYEFAARAAGTHRFPWGNDASRVSADLWRRRAVRQPDFDQTDTDSPVYGLYSGVLEWTDSLQTPYRPKPHPRQLIGSVNFDDYLASYLNTRVVRGGPYGPLVELPPDPRELALGPLFRFPRRRTDSYALLGFRCACSLKPQYLSP